MTDRQFAKFTDMDRLRDELIQVAAVACAIIEDLEYGVADFGRQENQFHKPQGQLVVDEIVAERMAQDLTWGAQSHSPEKWMTILMEEVGEAAEEIGFDPHSAYSRISDWVAELGLIARAELEGEQV